MGFDTSEIIEWVRENCSGAKLIDLKDDTPLISSGLFDSLNIVELVMEFEEKEGCIISPSLVIPENFETPAKIAALLIKASVAETV